MSKLIHVLFGKTEVEDDIDLLKKLLDQAIEEHQEAADRHRKSLETLKKEVTKMERRRGKNARGS